MPSEDHIPPHQPTREAFEAYADRFSAIARFQNTVANDFGKACEEAVARPSEHAWRNVVRCFGSSVEALSSAMKDVAVNLCELYGRELNRFLQQKLQEKTTSTFSRVRTSYRLVSEFLPDSPLAHLDDLRWDQLRQALWIRNRIMHPTSIEDLSLTEREVTLVINTTTAFTKDVLTFCNWYAQEYRTLTHTNDIPVRRLTPKVGRNEPCPCGSNRKFKNCCGVA